MGKKIVAFESANSFVKVYHDGKSIIYPNTLTSAGKERFNTLGTNRSKNVYEVNGKRFTAGETINYITSSSPSISRYSSEQYYIESIIAISQFVSDGDIIDVATGIPADHYKDKERAALAIEAALKGTHTLTVNGKEKRFTIDAVHVTMQGLASFFYTVIDEWGNADIDMVNRYTNSETLVIDIGWGSCDVVSIYENTVTDYRTLMSSMKTAYTYILESLQEAAAKEGRRVATARIQLLELERQLRHGDVFYFSNEVYDATRFKDEAFKKVANDILLEANSYRSLDDYTTVLFTGGGTSALLNDLKPLLADSSGKLKENIYILSENQTANVKGYYVYAKYIK